ncbi:MAG: hypothetical protein AAGD96_04210 [Chloroflexota bacterium]
MSKSIEILRFLRFSPGGKRKMRIRGELYENVNDIPDERVRRVIKQSIVEMVEMAGGVEQLFEDGFFSELPAQMIVDVKPPAIEPEPKTAIEAAPTIREVVEDPIEKIKESVEVVHTDLNEGYAPPPALKLNTFPPPTPEPESSLANQSFFGRLRGGLRGRTPNPEVMGPPPDIASQINTILQGMLEQSPQFVGRQVELRSSVNGELVFIVDGRSFDGVSEISDENAAQIIRQAISAWESR